MTVTSETYCRDRGYVALCLYLLGGCFNRCWSGQPRHPGQAMRLLFVDSLDFARHSDCRLIICIVRVPIVSESRSQHLNCFLLNRDCFVAGQKTLV